MNWLKCLHSPELHTATACNCLPASLNRPIAAFAKRTKYPETERDRKSQCRRVVFQRAQIPPQRVTHCIAFRVTQLCNPQGLLKTHSSHALASSHRVDSPSSLEVINDFLWHLSKQSAPHPSSTTLLLSTSGDDTSLSWKYWAAACLNFD